MIKFFVIVGGFALALINATIAYKYAKRRSTWLPPFNAAMAGFALTLLALIILIKLLYVLDLYPE